MLKKLQILCSVNILFLTFLELQTLPPRAGHISFNSRVIFPILIKFYRKRDTFILELPLAFPGPEICP